MALSTSGNIKRIYLAASVVLVILVVYQITREDVLLQPDKRLDAVMESVTLPTATDPLLQEAAAELARAQKALAAPMVQAPLSTAPAQTPSPSISVASDAWQLADSAQPAPTMSLPESISVYAPVSVNMDSPSFPEPGQQLGLTLPGGERLQVNVESSNTNPNGDYSWRGHLDGHGDEYPVVMTYGGNSVFATITTPKGSYTLESVNGSGWVYKNPSEFELSQPGTNDYLEIPHDH